MSKEESWTREHDLALLYLAVAYGTDHELSEEELEVIVWMLEEWLGNGGETNAQELVMEAFSVYLEGDLSTELSRSIQTLEKTLTSQQKQRALEDLMRVAAADGILLSTEQNLIDLIAGKWGLKDIERELMLKTSAHLEVDEGWSLLHDIALLYVIIAHSTDNRLSEGEIREMIDRLSEWQPDLDEKEIRSVLREVLQSYSQELDASEIRHTVESIRKLFTRVQRFAVLSDLLAIARVDGPANDHALDMIDSLSRTWKIDTQPQGKS